MQEQPSANQMIAEVLSRWPEAIPVLIRHRMCCVGCAMARFETVAEVAGNYHLDVDALLDELLAAVRSAGSPAHS